MPLQATSGAASYDAFGGGVAAVPNYIEDVFSTWLYPGDSGGFVFASSGVDITGGGMFWVKGRGASTNNFIFSPSLTSANHYLQTNTTAAQSNSGVSDNNFEPITNGGGMRFGGAFTGISSNAGGSGTPYVSWTFREQPKFFDVVTYTGNGVQGRQISHALGSVPGCYIVKCTSSGAGWWVYHRGLSENFIIRLNSTGNASNAGVPNAYLSAPTSTSFIIGNDNDVNESGQTYVAYLFAHNAGGFGLSGTDNVISCGSYTGTGATLDVNLGYEVQFVLIKPTSVAGNWTMMDNMRGMTQVGIDGTARLRPNTSEAESALGGSYGAFPNATGFTVKSSPGVDDYNASGQTYIYIAIRRGPMRTPTTGTSVFVPVTSSATGSVLTSNFPVDMGLAAGRGAVERGINDRLRGIANTDPGASPWLVTQGTAAETLNSNNPSLYNANNTSIQTGAYFGSASAVSYLFGRAPGFFDEVCYTGTGSARTVAHNLGVAPELMIVKRRDAAGAWGVYTAATGASALLQLESSAAVSNGAPQWNDTAPTSSVFSLAAVSSTVNTSGGTYVWYGFASCPGVSKVGSYTGTGTTQVINCGFTGGSRFVLIKRTDSTGDWFVWDTARGIVAGNDPYLLLNSTAAEVTNTDFIDTASTGFEISSTAPAAINASGGTFIFLAIA